MVLVKVIEVEEIPLKQQLLELAVEADLVLQLRVMVEMVLIPLAQLFLEVVGELEGLAGPQVVEVVAEGMLLLVELVEQVMLLDLEEEEEEEEHL